MQKQYVTLNLDNINKITIPENHVSTSRHLRRYWRYWRRLSQLQKNLVILATTIFVFILYLITSHSTYDVDKIQQEFISDESNRILNGLDNEVINEDEMKVPKATPTALYKPRLKSYKKNKVTQFTSRQLAVINAAKHAWKGYKNYAWGHDHLKPISRTWHDWFNLGLTLVDSLDTLFLMNLTTEFNEARKWIETDLDFDKATYSDVNLFEVTIRVMGGLLSAYQFSKDGLFLEKAVDLGDRLMPCFTFSNSPIPLSDINLASRIAHPPKWSPDSSTAEVTTLQLEFRELSRCTNNPKYEEISFKVSKHVHNLKKTNGLVPIFINPNSGKFNYESDIKLGARGDSYYEYLLKQWIQTGKTIDFLKADYIEAVDGIMEKLVKVTNKRKLTFIGELKPRSREFSPKMDHLICYLPGTLALGVHNGMPEWHMKLAEQIMNTCYHMYTDQPTGLAPEISYFSIDNVDEHPDMYVHQQDAHNLLRPEFVESLWAMYQITGNETYQSWGWDIFQAMEKYSKVAGGYTSIGNVLNEYDTRPRDSMESFFMSETLKYLFLLFSSDRQFLSLDKFVMNSEGHPLPIHTS